MKKVNNPNLVTLYSATQTTAARTQLNIANITLVVLKEHALSELLENL